MNGKGDGNNPGAGRMFGRLINKSLLCFTYRPKQRAGRTLPLARCRSVMRNLTMAKIQGESTMQYMYEEDWAEFNEKFPGAAGFIRERTLWNELGHLRAGMEFGGLSIWQTKRLSELEKWEQTVNEIRGE